MKNRTYRRAVGAAVAILGVLLILGAVGLSVWNIRTDIDAGEVNEELLSRVVDAIEAANAGADDGTRDYIPGLYDSDYVPGLFSSKYIPAALRKRELKSVIVDGREYVGVLTIPSLGIELSVMKTCDDKSIDVAPGRWCGTPYDDGFVIGGHNYRSHLGKIDRLREGDSVVFTDLSGLSFSYTVVGQEILNAYDGELLRDDEWGLSLFTCTLAGNRRIVVRCLAESKSTASES